ncbi:MAG: DUF4058 family protein [Planctomycetia bacterium]|nr:DUF4058 family protein [Planctomycetia bacterium]
MPMHDWTKVRSGTYHNFHYRWVASIMDNLNSGVLPSGYFAMAEQVIGGPEPEVFTLRLNTDFPAGSSAGVVALAPPKAKPTSRIVMTADVERYAHKANRIVVRHELGKVLAVIEIVSPGNKHTAHAIRSFVEKTAGLLFDGINLLVIDPLPPGPRDPQGIHALIWSEFTDHTFELPPARQLTIMSYQTEPIKTAYIEPIAVGAALPTMPLFLEDEFYVDLPLELTYQDTWNALPTPLKQLVE